MIVGKPEMARGLLAHIWKIVISFPVHYSIDLQLLIGCNIGFPLYVKPLQRVELYIYVSITSPNLNFHKMF
jgi:hypothetical protein